MRDKAIIGYLLVILFFLGISAYAQDEKPTTDDILARMKAELNLTQAQADAVKPIIEEYTAKRQQIKESLKEQGVTDKSIILSRMEQLREEESQKLTQVLTPDQMKQWNKKQKLSDFLNKDQTSDTGWVPKGSGPGLGTSF